MKKIHTIASILLLGLWACSGVEATKEEVAVESNIFIKKQDFERGGMELVEMQPAFRKEVVQCIGTIDAPPQNRASISNFLGGYVVENPMLVGDKVKKGQLILKLDNPDFIHLQENYLALKAQVEYSQLAYERQSKLYKDSISSAESFQAAKSQYEVQSARLSALEQKLDLLDVNVAQLNAKTMKSSVAVYAPISGIISKVNTQLGSYVSPQTVMLEIIDGSHLHLELEVYEKDIAKIKKEQAVYFKIADVGEEVLQGDIHLIGNTVDAERRTVQVHGHIPDSSVAQLRVGMFVSAEIEISNQKGWKYPEGTVIKKEGHWMALKVKEETEDGYRCELVELGEANTNALEYYREDKSEVKLLKGAYHYIGKEEDGHEH